MTEIVEMSSHDETGPTKPGEAEAQATEEVASEETVETSLKIPQSEGRPEWLPEKFESAEDLAKAYGELEKSQGSEEKETAKAVEAMGADTLQPFADEYHTTGQISEDSYGKLQGMGLKRDFVDNYIAGVKAQADAATGAMYDAAGGKAVFETMVAWASDNLPANEIAAFNQAMDTGSVDTATMAVKALSSSYHGAHGTAPKLLQAGTAGTGLEVYESVGQMMKDMQDPKYKDPHDDSFRKKVEAKLNRSNIGKTL